MFLILLMFRLLPLNKQKSPATCVAFLFIIFTIFPKTRNPGSELFKLFQQHQFLSLVNTGTRQSGKVNAANEIDCIETDYMRSGGLESFH